MVYKLRGGIDLHIHSTASDGSLTPIEILKTAHQVRLGAFSITDHDTINGVKEVLDADLPKDLKFIPGIEISAAAPMGIGGSLHLLGYGIDCAHNGLNKLLALLHESRNTRTPRIIKRLNQLGIPLSLKDIQKYAGKSMVGRPHIAMALVGEGYAMSVDDAFERFLGKGKDAYVDKFRIPCKEAIETIAAAGGITILAHPLLISQDYKTIEKLVNILIPMGLSGIECIYPQHPPDAVAFYQSLAKRKGLLITGGTDFHGPDITPGIQLGSAGGDFFVPFELYQQLITKIMNHKK